MENRKYPAFFACEYDTDTADRIQQFTFKLFEDGTLCTIICEITIDEAFVEDEHDGHPLYSIGARKYASPEEALAEIPPEARASDPEALADEFYANFDAASEVLNVCLGPSDDERAQNLQ